MGEYCIPFEKLRTESIAIAGGKGAQLGELAAHGFPVPPGFAVTTAAFDAFTHHNKVGGRTLDSAIYEAIEGMDTNDTEQVNRVSEEIKGWVGDGTIPREAEEAILELHKILDSEYVAVRSSATAEDAATASWAGELDSYTNVKKEGLLEAVKKCWASLFTPRALVYRIEKEMRHEEISVAVVVQKMVQSEVAGVVFTVHPVTKDTNSMVIEAGYGLGESVVAGKITPDMYVVRKKDFTIETTQVSSQKRMISMENGIQEERDVPTEKQELQKLPNEMVQELAEIAANIEKHYDSPQDIEFALEKGKIFIVQTRPITTL